MAETFHFRFEPKNMPNDWCDDSLHRAAVGLNKDTDIPVVFPQDSLDYLVELGFSLPRRGISFITSAHEFIDQLAMGMLVPCDEAVVQELRDVKKRKEVAVANRDFDTARALRDQQYDLQKEIIKLAIHEVAKGNIIDALIRDGVDPEDHVRQSG